MQRYFQVQVIAAKRAIHMARYVKEGSTLGYILERSLNTT